MIATTTQLRQNPVMPVRNIDGSTCKDPADVTYLQKVCHPSLPLYDHFIYRFSFRISLKWPSSYTYAFWTYIKATEWPASGAMANVGADPEGPAVYIVHELITIQMAVAPRTTSSCTLD